MKAMYICSPLAIIDSSCTSGTSTLDTYYSNFIARQLYAQKCLKYWLTIAGTVIFYFVSSFYVQTPLCILADFASFDVVYSFHYAYKAFFYYSPKRMARSTQIHF